MASPEPDRSFFHSLAHRNFRLFFAGQSLSLIGTWTQNTTMGWLVERLTGSAMMQGVVGSIAQLPALVLPPIAGVITDRFDRKRLLIVTQSLAMAQALALAALVATEAVQIWQIIFFNLILAAVNAFDMPARQTFLGDMLENREDLANAIAINSTMVNGARLFGPVLAAALIVSVGEQGGFFVNALSFLGVILALSAMRISKKNRIRTAVPLIQGFHDGWEYISQPGPIRAVLAVVATVSLFGLPYALLLPRFTRSILNGGPHDYAILMTAPGVGALAGGLLMVWRGLRGVTLRIAISPIIAGCSLAGASFCTSVWPTAVFLFGAGFGFLLILNSGNTLLQSIAAPSMRGRVMGYYAIAFIGMAPIGNLLVPGLAHVLTIPAAMRISACICCLAGILFGIVAPRFHDEIRKRLAEDHTERLPESPPDTAVSTAAVIPADPSSK